uniref:NADH-ubiquinone oxidoreductase chain 4L n=1 Tax=Varanus salvator TaxID=62051 RepID=B3GT37_VARSL|nr:NADH dehydrogenase subunit 4L [Varanus salvator]ACD81917.1 NADH dehydrogenase subunit 4L [Varanus salvator]BAU25932.1 NADH dehydrogenase subunit 4L [Varanus salvator]
MTTTSLILVLTFTINILGLSFHRTHLISALLCIEGMMLTLFMITSLSSNNLNTLTSLILPMILLTLSACEAATGLGLLVATARTHSNDHLNTMNILKC